MTLHTNSFQSLSHFHNIEKVLAEWSEQSVFYIACYVVWDSTQTIWLKICIEKYIYKGRWGYMDSFNFA